MGEPQFHLGDIVFKEINNKMIQCTIVPFPNGPTVIHNYDLTEARDSDYSHRYNADNDDHGDRFTSDGQLYAFSDGVDSFYYLLLLPTGEKIITDEIRLLEHRAKDILSRRVSNINKKRAMNEFRHGQADKFQEHIPLLPGDINNYISSYLTQTPLSSRVNTRINNRLNPGTPSSVIPFATIAEYDAHIMNNISDDEDTTNGGTRKTRKTRKRRKVRKPRKIGKKRKTSKRRKR